VLHIRTPRPAMLYVTMKLHDLLNCNQAVPVTPPSARTATFKPPELGNLSYWSQFRLHRPETLFTNYWHCWRHWSSYSADVSRIFPSCMFLTVTEMSGANSFYVQLVLTRRESVSTTTCNL